MNSRWWNCSSSSLLRFTRIFRRSARSWNNRMQCKYDKFRACLTFSIHWVGTCGGNWPSVCAMKMRWTSSSACSNAAHATRAHEKHISWFIYFYYDLMTCIMCLIHSAQAPLACIVMCNFHHDDVFIVKCDDGGAYVAADVCDCRHRLSSWRCINSSEFLRKSNWMGFPWLN